MHTSRVFGSVIMTLALVVGTASAQGWRDPNAPPTKPAGPPQIMPRLIMLTHGDEYRSALAFSHDGKRLYLSTGTGKTAEALEEGGSHAVTQAAVRAARDEVADGAGGSKLSISGENRAGSANVEGKTLPMLVRDTETVDVLNHFDIETGAHIASWSDPDNRIRGYQKILPTKDGMFLAGMARFESQIVLWDITQAKIIGRTEIERPCDITFTPDEKYLLVSRSKEIHKLEMPTFKTVSILTLPSDVHFGECGIAVSPDGKMLATKNLIWDMGTGEQRVLLRNDEGRYQYFEADRGLTFSPDSTQLIGIGDREDISLGSILTKQYEHPFGGRSTTNGHEYDTLSCDDGAISPDFHYVVAADNLSHIRLYSVQTKTVIAILMPVHSYIQGISFSPDGNTVATSNYDGSTFVWDVSSVIKGREGRNGKR